MAAVQQVNNSAAATATASAGAKKTEDPQDRFLKLLVTQMKSQDPLNPLDNAQVTTQLAQISTVSGIEKLNSTLSNIGDLFSAGQTMQAASMIGRRVLAEGSHLTLAKGAGVAGVDLPGPVDTLVVKIKDAGGRVVDSVDLGERNQAGSLAFEWDGKTADGKQLPDGNYTFSVEATQGGEKVDVTALAVAQVGSVSLTGQGAVLNTQPLGAVALSKVRQVM